MLKESIVINRAPEEIFEWLSHFAENYRSWHPDHITAQWIKGKNFETGSVLYTEEYIGKSIEKLRFKTTKLLPNQLIEYKLLFPESLICSGGSFRIEPQNGSSIFTATLSFRFEIILSKIFTSKLREIRNHMKEEGENLKKILEVNTDVLNKRQ